VDSQQVQLQKALPLQVVKISLSEELHRKALAIGSAARDAGVGESSQIRKVHVLHSGPSVPHFTAVRDYENKILINGRLLVNADEVVNVSPK
jgi:hypothetical protein